jgi:nicotinic acid mononucleotide adenylyltransferase
MWVIFMNKQNSVVSLKTSELYKKIKYSLLSKSWLEEYKIEEKLIKDHIDNIGYVKKVRKFIESNDYSAKNTLNLTYEILNDLSNTEPSFNWLFYIYHYSLNKSFPGAVEIKLDKNLDRASETFLKVFSLVLEFQKHSNDESWQSRYPVELIKEDEADEEYLKFVYYCKKEYIYEMMKLNQEVLGYNTLDHICGVHFLALFISRQLIYAGLHVNISRVSGAAFGHDLGKYGCRQNEAKSVPYLHYYYTDIWFKKHNIPYIGHIAVNHSTWDLELENLPVESLILIYSDFRVKNIKDVDGKEKMHIFSLKDSFDVILNKLDNVNEEKSKRYKKVYSKLKDFEDYMIHLGINIDPEAPAIYEKILSQNKKYNYSLMNGDEIIRNFKYHAIKHNLNLMYKFRDEASLSSILEIARSQDDWKNLRMYLEAIDEYSTYLTQKQKLITLKFLYDELVHPEDDIRREAAEIIGSIIATFDEEYRKIVPLDAIIAPPKINSSKIFAKYLDLFINPDYKIIPAHREWIGYNLSTMISSLFMNCSAKLSGKFARIFLELLKNSTGLTENSQLYLIECLKYIPLIKYEDNMDIFFVYIDKMLDMPDGIIRISLLEAILGIIDKLDDNSPYKLMLEKIYEKKILYSKKPCESYLNYKISMLTDLPVRNYDISNEKISDMYLSNLKTATSWVIKRTQVEILLDCALNHPESYGLHTAMHYCNLLKVSAVESVRNRAGEALVKIIPFLSIEERNDVAVELLRALEIEGYQFTEYIPGYLGRIILYLKPVELDEIIDDLALKVKKSNHEICQLILKTIGISIVNYSLYSSRFKESDDKFRSRLIKMLGIILNGLVNYNPKVRQSAMTVIGKEIFDSDAIKMVQKKYIFNLIAKKMLTLLTNDVEEDLLFLTNSANLNFIYRFITDYTFANDSITLDYPKRAAFFPGTFDPFTLSHKQIATTIRNMGFEVYLQVDEFSWSKLTLPNLLRKNIINMSIADELNIFIYPEEFPTNLTNPDNLKVLKNNFPESEVYIVAGSDVLINASSYKDYSKNGYLYSFSHIVFERKSNSFEDRDKILLDNVLKKIKGNVIKLTLPPQYEDISSTLIRSYIDENRDITSLLDPLAQNYIYDYGFYKSEPQYKTLIKTVSFEIDVIEEFNKDIIEQLSLIFDKDYRTAFLKLSSFFDKLNARFIVIRDANSKKVLGFSAFHWIRSHALYDELKNTIFTEYIRENAGGRIISIDGIYTDKNSGKDNMEQVILTETLAFCIGKDYDYAVYHNLINNLNMDKVYEILSLNGFERLPSGDDDPLFVVNMSSPSTLSLDLQNFIKEPYKSSPLVISAVNNCRKRLKCAISALYPGNLTLSFDIDIVNEALIKKICSENGVSDIQEVPRRLGPYMCVPFGNTLNRSIVPNTITKALHTEKLFEPDMKSFSIGPFPYYLDLEYQIKMIGSFNRPLILIDDILNKGYRLKALSPILNRGNIQVQDVIVGILSGRGKEIMDIKGKKVDCAYFIPKLKVWFNESAMYPFIGGDTLWRDVYPERNLVPSINLILPYTSPTFLKDASNTSLYDLSRVCIENSAEIISAIETEYQKVHERKLTLASFGEVFVSPRCPDRGKYISYDFNISPLSYLKNDLEQLRRLKNSILK